VPEDSHCLKGLRRLVQEAVVAVYFQRTGYLTPQAAVAVIAAGLLHSMSLSAALAALTVMLMAVPLFAIPVMGLLSVPYTRLPNLLPVLLHLLKMTAYALSLFLVRLLIFDFLHPQDKLVHYVFHGYLVLHCGVNPIHFETLS